MEESIEGPNGVKAVERAIDLLSCFTLQVPELSLIEICARTGLPKATAY